MPFFLLAVAVLAISTAAPLVHAAAPAPALTVATARVGLAALLLAGASGRSMARFFELPRREILLILLAGLLLGAHFGVWITSLYLTSTAASVALVATQPIFAGLLGWLSLGDRVTAREVAGIAVAGGGCLLLAAGDAGASSSGPLLGDLLALLGALTAAGYFLVGRRMRASIPLTPYLAAVNLVAGAALLAAAIVVGAPFAGFPPGAYVAMAACAVVPSIVGHTLLNLCVRRIPVHLVSLAILGEPIGASVLTWIFFAETPPLHAATGGAVILAGIAIGFTRVGKRAG